MGCHPSGSTPSDKEGTEPLGVHRAPSITRSLSHIGSPQVLSEHDGFLLSLAKDPSMKSKFVQYREQAFVRQSGRCFYCSCEMWRGKSSANFCKRHSLTPAQAGWLQSTAEHVVAKCDGGADSAANIVAACWRCNRGRHARKKPKTPSDFATYVKRRLRALRWHDFDVRGRGVLSVDASQHT
jgi:hypothetical protein